MMDKNDIDAAARNRERIKHLQTREKKEEIVDRYQKGDKTASIQEDYDIGPGSGPVFLFSEAIRNLWIVGSSPTMTMKNRRAAAVQESPNNSGESNAAASGENNSYPITF